MDFINKKSFTHVFWWINHRIPHHIRIHKLLRIRNGTRLVSPDLEIKFDPSIQMMQQQAARELQNNINIRPVLKKNQGEEVGIFVAKDFNFADVYNLELRR